MKHGDQNLVATNKKNHKNQGIVPFRRMEGAIYCRRFAKYRPRSFHFPQVPYYAAGIEAYGENIPSTKAPRNVFDRIQVSPKLYGGGFS